MFVRILGTEIQYFFQQTALRFKQTQIDCSYFYIVLLLYRLKFTPSVLESHFITDRSNCIELFRKTGILEVSQSSQENIFV